MDLRTVLASLVGSASQSVRTHSPVTDHYMRYVGALLERALGQWASVHSAGVKCGLELRGQQRERVRCGGPAIGACMACGVSVCVGHALVSPEHILCLGCAHAVTEKLRGRSGGVDSDPFVASPPPWERRGDTFGGGRPEHDEEAARRREHLARLGLDEGATETQVRARYRALASENHPDRARTPASRERATQKLKELNEAYSYLTRRRAA